MNEINITLGGNVDENKAKATNAIIQRGIEKCETVSEGKTYKSDMHSKLYNEDDFIIGTWKAKEFLNQYGVFDAIEKVMQYEDDQFGEVITEIHNPERLAAMLAYVVGSEVLADCETLDDTWDALMNKEEIAAVKAHLQSKLVRE